MMTNDECMSDWCDFTHDRGYCTCNDRPCAHVLKAWVQKSTDERNALVESCEGMDELFRDLGGDEYATDYYAFLYLTANPRLELKPRHIDEAYEYAELWSKWDLENQDLTAEMSSYDSFYFFMDNGLDDPENLNP